MYKDNTIGINAEIVDSGLIDSVYLLMRTPAGTTKYTISVEEIKEYGKKKRYKNFEEQYFIPKEKLRKV